MQSAGQQVLALLGNLQSPDNQTQRKIYAQIEELSASPEFYHSLARLRYHAGVVLKSQLTLHYSKLPPQLIASVQSYSLQALLDPSLQVGKAAAVVTSFLASKRPLNEWPALCTLLQQSLAPQAGVDRVQVALDLVRKLGEDYRHSSQNEGEQTALLRELMVRVSQFVEAKWPTKIRLLALQCLNLLIYFCLQFCKDYLNPLLSLCGESEESIRLKAVQGLCEINNFRKDLINHRAIGVMQALLTDSSYLLRKEACTFWLQFFNCAEDVAEDAVHFGPVLRGAMLNLRFEQEDLKAVMEEGDDFIEDTGKDQEEQSFFKVGSQTLRRRSGQLLQHLANCFGEHIWQEGKQLLSELLSSADWRSRESAVLFVGIVYQICEAHLAAETPELIHFLLQRTSLEDNALLLSTLIWTISAFTKPIVKAGGLVTDYVKFLALNLAKPETSLRRAACSALSSLVEERPPEVASNFKDLLLLVTHSVTLVKGQCLKSVCALLSTMAECLPQSAKSQPVEPVYAALLGRVRAEPSAKELAALIQCLTSVNQIYGPLAEIVLSSQLELFLSLLGQFTQGKNEQYKQKQLLLRVIDLLWSLFFISVPRLEKQLPRDALRFLFSMLAGQDSEIKQFLYSLIGGMASKSKSLLQPYISEILSTTQACLTRQPVALVNNCAICLTQLLLAYNLSQFALEAAKKFFQLLRAKTLGGIASSNLHRCLAKLIDLDPRIASLYQGQVGMLFGSTKGQTQDRIWQGAFKVTEANPRVALQFLHILINSAINSDISAEVRQQFRKLLLEAKKAKGDAEWEQYLSNPVFAPGLRAKLRAQYDI